MKAGYTPPPPPPPLHDMKILTSYGGTADQLHGTVNVITADCCGGKLDACTNDTITGTFGMKVLLNVPTPSNRFSIRDNCWRKPSAQFGGRYERMSVRSRSRIRQAHVAAPSEASSATSGAPQLMQSSFNFRLNMQKQRLIVSSPVADLVAIVDYW
jgi:hypothetical protein